jgi:hypothetical protein
VTGRIASRAVAVAVAALALHGAGAGAQDHERLPRGALRDGTDHYQVVIAPGWRPVTAPSGTRVTYQAPGGRAHLAITRVAVGRRTVGDSDALAAEVQRGVERATPGFRALRSRAGEARGVPTLDLWYERTPGPGGRQVLSRYLFFKQHTVVMTIGLAGQAGDAERRAAESMIKSFTPFQVP